MNVGSRTWKGWSGWNVFIPLLNDALIIEMMDTRLQRATQSMQQNFEAPSGNLGFGTAADIHRQKCISI
jgi:hypothetical protein